MKPLVPAQKPNTASGSSSTTKSGMVSKPPSSAARRVGVATSALTGKKATSPTLKEREDDLVLKFDVLGEIEEFQFDV